MLDALFWGIVATSSLILGGLIGSWFNLGKRTLGVIMAFGAGYSFFANASPMLLSFVQAFAGGAMLVMLSNTMMPEAHQHAGNLAGICTVLGFALAVVIVILEHS